MAAAAAGAAGASGGGGGGGAAAGAVTNFKPIRAHPYRRSPAKVQAGRGLVQEFLGDGSIVRPITSEWGALVLLVPKPKGG